MKRFAALLAMLVLVLSLSLTVFASESPAEDAVGGILSGRENETVSEDHDDRPDGLEAAAEENAPTVQNNRVEADDSSAGDARPEPSQTPTDQETQATQTATQPSTQPVTQPSTLTPTSAPEDPAVNSTALIVILVCGAVLLILLVIIIVLLMKKRKPADGDEVPRSGPSRGIPIRVEVLSGLCYNADLHFHLRRNLTIGCDSGCDLVFEDARMLPMHAVISRASGVVTIAECADTGNTYVGGMKIFAPNRLRSGDIVTVGSTTFRVFFEK